MKIHPGKILAGLFAGTFAIIWIGGWSAGTLFFDYMIGMSAWKQHETRHWAQTAGTVRSSQLKTHTDSDGTSYSLELKYDYALDGRNFTGTKDSELGNGMNIGSSGVKARAAQLRAGTPVTVYYNPKDPAQAVLRKGMAPNDWTALGFFAIFLMPFNIIMLGSWYFVFHWLTTRIQKDPPVGVKVYETGTELRVRLPHSSGLVWAAGAVGITSFILIFVLAGALLIFKLTFAVYIAWAALFCVALFAYMRQSRKIADGQYDLVFDGLRRTIVVPPCDEKRAAVEFKAADMEAVTLERDETRDSDNDIVVKFSPTLVYNNGLHARVTQMSTVEEARHFAGWLAKKLKTDFRDIEKV